MNKVIKSTDVNGNEIITLLDENDREGISITMESIFENREDNIELTAKNILNTTEIESLKATVSVPIRLANKAAFLINKTTQEKYVIKMGNIPTLANRIDNDITGSFLMIEVEGNTDPEKVINLLVPYKKDGTIPESFPYTIIEETNA